MEARISLCTFLFSLMLSTSGWSQTTIWEERFDYPDGTQTGGNNNSSNPSLDWTSTTCQACIDTADWWEVRSGQMEARDVNELVFLQTEVINISGFKNVQFNLDISEVGDHEGYYFGLDTCMDQDKEDYVNVFYRLDDGQWELIANYLNWCGLYQSCGTHTLYGDDGINSGDCRDHDDDWNEVAIHQNIQNGNQLEIRVELINSSNEEFIRIDNIEVAGDLLLPVDFKSFQTTLKGTTVSLIWETSLERNSDQFQIQRSANGFSEWVPIGIISAAGYSDTLIHYSFEDLPPIAGQYFYRIKQIDFDGNYSYSDIGSVLIPAINSPYPNPAHEFIWVPVSAYGNVTTEVRIFDPTAREIKVRQFREEAVIKIELKYLMPGHYILVYEKNQNLIFHRFIKIQ